MLRFNAFILLSILLSVVVPSFGLTGGSPNLDPKFQAVRPIAVLLTRLHQGPPAFPELVPEICTATFITRRHLLTAAHCLQLNGKDTFPAHNLIIGEFGEMTVKTIMSDLYREKKWARTGQKTSLILNKDFRIHLSPGWDSKKPGKGFDLGVIELLTEIDVTPLNISFEPLKAEQTVLLTGYGCDRENPPGDFKIGSSHVHRLKNNLIEFKKSEPVRQCHGDSGGPVLIEEGGAISIVGINSHSISGTILGNEDGDRAVRLDPSASEQISDWLKTLIRKSQAE